MKMKRGYSLIELIISMSLFAVFSTLIIMSFVSFANIQGQTATMKESQQKLRVALDGIVRQTKEADKVKLPSSNKLTLLFGNTSAVIYEVVEVSGKNKLFYRECNMNNYIKPSYMPCNVADIDTYTASQDLLSSTGTNTNADIYLDTTNPVFDWQAPKENTGDEYSLPATIRVRLQGKITNMNKFYGDDLTLETYITLEPKK